MGSCFNGNLTEDNPFKEDPLGMTRSIIHFVLQKKGMGCGFKGMLGVMRLGRGRGRVPPTNV